MMRDVRRHLNDRQQRRFLAAFARDAVGSARGVAVWIDVDPATFAQLLHRAAGPPRLDQVISPNALRDNASYAFVEVAVPELPPSSVLESATSDGMARDPFRTHERACAGNSNRLWSRPNAFLLILPVAACPEVPRLAAVDVQAAAGAAPWFLVLPILPASVPTDVLTLRNLFVALSAVLLVAVLTYRFGTPTAEHLSSEPIVHGPVAFHTEVPNPTPREDDAPAATPAVPTPSAETTEPSWRERVLERVSSRRDSDSSTQLVPIIAPRADVLREPERFARQLLELLESADAAAQQFVLSAHGNADHETIVAECNNQVNFRASRTHLATLVAALDRSTSDRPELRAALRQRVSLHACGGVMPDRENADLKSEGQKRFEFRQLAPHVPPAHDANLVENVSPCPCEVMDWEALDD